MIDVIIIIAFIILLFVVWVIISPGTIRKYKGENSLSEKYVMDINGAPNGFFINSVDTNNPVLLLVSSGPGTDGQSREISIFNSAGLDEGDLSVTRSFAQKSDGFLIFREAGDDSDVQNTGAAEFRRRAGDSFDRLFLLRTI